MDIVQKLQSVGKKCTKERLKIFSFLEKRHITSSSDVVNTFAWDVWRASVFRTLNLFVDSWIIRKVQRVEKWDFYELNDEEHHHEHMQCSSCNELLCFDSVKICKQLMDIAKQKGFTVSQHSINIVGKCETCT